MSETYKHLRGFSHDKLTINQRKPNSKKTLVSNSYLKIAGVAKSNKYAPLNIENTDETDQKAIDLLTKRPDDHELATNYAPPSKNHDKQSDRLLETEQFKDNPSLIDINKNHHSEFQPLIIPKKSEAIKIINVKSKKGDSDKIDKTDSPEDEELKNRKFRRNKNSNNTKSVIYSISFAFILIICFGLSMIPVPIMTSSVRSSLEFINTFVSFSSDVKMAYFTFLHSIVTREAVNTNGVLLFTDLSIKISNAQNKIVQDIETIPDDFESFKNFIKIVLLEDICANVLQPKHSITSS